MAHVFESFDSDAAFKREILASEDAYLVGRCSADDAAMPTLFVQSRALTFAWERARRDRAAIAAEQLLEGTARSLPYGPTTGAGAEPWSPTL